MAVNAEEMDFSAVLANMEAKRAAIDLAISSLRAAITLGALGGSTTGEASVSLAGGTAYGASTEIPNGAFHGKTVSEAIKSYLSAIKRKQTTREVIDALKRGGIESTSDHFDTIVYNALDRMRTVTGEIAKFGKLWGMTEWLPPGMRATVVVKSQGRSRSQKPIKSAARRNNQHRANTDEGPTLPSRIEELLGAAPDKSFTPSQIAEALHVEAIGVNVRLKKMVDRQRIIKVGPGQYRAGKSGVVRMPTAG
jgi:hypothetical protein